MIDVGGESGAEVADFEADVVGLAVFFVADGEGGGLVGVGVFEGVGAEVIDDGAEEVAVGDGEFVFVGVFDGEGFLVEAEEVGEFGGDFVADAADGDGFHGEKAVFKAGDFGEVGDLFECAVGDGDEFLLVVFGGLGVGWVESESELAHEG